MAKRVVGLHDDINTAIMASVRFGSVRFTVHGSRFAAQVAVVKAERGREGEVREREKKREQLRLSDSNYARSIPGQAKRVERSGGHGR